MVAVRPARVNILGVGISAINMQMAVETIEGWIASREQHFVCVTTVNEVVQCQSDPALRETINRSGLVTPDGMPLVWLSRWQGFAHVDRVYGPDLMLAACARSVATQYRHFFYGGTEGVVGELVQRLSGRFPGLQIAGTYAPPFRPLSVEEDTAAVDMINASNPDIVWVGMGGAKQNRWMASHVGRLKAPVLVGVGAAFDFHAGRKKQAPRWMQRNGLEWLYRLSQEPRRLWRRYLLSNPLFVLLVTLQIVGLRRYSLS